MRARTWLIGVAFVATNGCLPSVEGEPLGHPRIRVWLHDIDATGAKEVFTIDPAGRFVLEDWVAIGETKWTVHRCLGQLPSECVAPVFASFDAADLDGTKQTFGEDGQTEAGPQTLLLYVQPSTAGHPRDRAEFDRLIALVEPLRAEAALQCPDHPHQVVKEFWGARLSALYDRQRRGDRVRTDIRKSFDQVRVQLRNWAASVSLDDEQLTSMLGLVTGCADELERGISTVASVEGERSQWLDTNRDPVVSKLEAILDGRVGEPFSDDDEPKVRKEAARRAEHKIPPGYKDAEKDQKKGDSAGDSAGDYLVWEQLLREAEQRKCDVLFVTADVKEDWWRRRAEQLLGPRVELVDELCARAGGRLCMLQPHEFLRTANESFDLNLDPESVAAVERADSSYEASRWTKEGLRALLHVLDDQAPTRAKVIRRAIEQGGYVSREEIYEIGGYNENRMLTGWTRPIRTWTQHLRDTGEIPANEGHSDVLEAQYKQGESRASGFQVPASLLELFEGIDEHD